MALGLSPEQVKPASFLQAALCLLSSPILLQLSPASLDVALSTASFQAIVSLSAF